MDDMQNNDFLNREFRNMIIGKELGNGAGRWVFEHRFDKTLVVKFEGGAKSFQNILEWDLWNELKHAPDYSKWLAPCVDISATGAVLIMKRTQPITEYRKLPDKLPHFINTDTKKDNFGILNGKLVCHDYGVTMFDPSLRLKKVEWW